LHALNVQYAFISVYTNILTLIFNLRMKDQSIKNVDLVGHVKIVIDQA